MTVQLYAGDCLEIMPTLSIDSIDSIVCDPPYGLSFMGKDWDHGVPGVAFWEAALRVAKPGAHLLAFGGTRTHHRLMSAIEDAGWEIRDCLMWVFGSGFPKSHDISKAIDKAAGAENVIGYQPDRWTGKGNSLNFSSDRPQSQAKITAPATDAAKQWDGWGTALKPAHEIIVRAIKPFPDQTERDIIVGNLCQKEAQLWLLLYVSTAGHDSTLSQAELNEVLSIAQWSAEKLTSTQADLCGAMDISHFASTVNMCLSIVTSWKSTLAELWNPGNTSTIPIASSGIIDSKTLRYLLSQTTLKNMLQAESKAPGSQLNALPAGRYLNAVSANISSIQTLSALDNAMYRERTKRLDATADLSPAWEPIIMAMKPLDGTFANNALVHGVAGINVDGCRIGSDAIVTHGGGGQSGNSLGWSGNDGRKEPTNRVAQNTQHIGRWPANLCLDEEAATMLDEQKHSVSRFFYVPKASKRDRDEGLEGMPLRPSYMVENGSKTSGLNGERYERTTQARNHHPTVKPTALMRWLVRLVTPPNGTILDPFMGSGSTGKAACLEGFSFVGIEIDSDYIEIARQRIQGDS